MSQVSDEQTDICGVVWNVASVSRLGNATFCFTEHCTVSQSQLLLLLAMLSTTVKQFGSAILQLLTAWFRH